MACFHPLKAWQQTTGTVVFTETGDILRSLSLPCGQCIGCRLEKSRQWATRVMHEASQHEHSVFITLTYSEDHLQRPSLNYRDYQLFMKRLRKHYCGNVRFYMCGEYGDKFGRPHFHACLFGPYFKDRELHTTLASGHKLYTSPTLTKLWGKGHATIGDVTFESAAYVARYVTKKVTGRNADSHYTKIDPETGEAIELEPEFSRMSLKPGIGAGWFEKYGNEVFPRNEVITNGHKSSPPRYYTKIFDKDIERFSDLMRIEVETKKFDIAKKHEENNTAHRLAVREKCAQARLSQLKRSI